MRRPCSARSVRTALFVALLAPASNLPALLARGGALGWLMPLALLPLALLAARRIEGLGSAGLAALWRGKVPLLALYYLWALSLSALTAGTCVDRLVRTDYPAAPRWLLSLALAAVAAYLIRKGIAPFLHAARIFALALGALLALFFVLGLPNLRGANLAVPGVHALCSAWEGLLPTAGTLAVATLGTFFPREREDGLGSGRGWMALWCLTASGLCLLVFGALGPRLAAEAPLPFSLTLQGLGFPGGFQRLEALGTAGWVLSDLTLLGLAALAGREMAAGRAWAAWPVLAGAFFGGWLLPNAVTAPWAPWLTGANLLLGALAPALAAPGRREGPGGISCG